MHFKAFNIENGLKPSTPIEAPGACIWTLGYNPRGGASIWGFSIWAHVNQRNCFTRRFGARGKKKAIIWYVYVQNMSKNVSKCINYDKMHLCLLYLFSPLSSIRTIFLSYRPGPLPLQKGRGTRGLPCCLNLIRSKSCMNRVKREKQNERRMHTIQEKT